LLKSFFSLSKNAQEENRKQPLIEKINSNSLEQNTGTIISHLV
jgi:hypothetical protein